MEMTGLKDHLSLSIKPRRQRRSILMDTVSVAARAVIGWMGGWMGGW